MKSIKHRLLSLLLTLVTILSLLPTAAFAASNTGSGLKITTNQAYWSTRLLANGTPYSYRPPLVDGKLVYCMDSGLGYHYATPSYLNSFTWTSGTGADADAVLQSAVTNSGLSEMDAVTVENVKWMMTYLNDCKASNVGQLFMAVQTYVWDHQSYKGEPGGDGDAGGYDSISVTGQPADWIEVLAVFAVKVAGSNDADAADVATMDADRIARLKAAFWDMTTIAHRIEVIHHPGSGEGDDGWTEKNLYITVTAKTAEEMKTEYHFNRNQIAALDELLEQRDLLRELIEDAYSVSGDTAALIRSLPEDLSPEREAVVRAACSLVGKVNYFWGGKSLVIGWDARWGELRQVTAAGSSTTGTYRPYGLDCSGFVDWVFYNQSGSSYVIGHGGGATMQHSYCTDISWADAQPGDLVFYPDNSHVGIVGGRDANGELLIIHCASGYNNVVITGKEGFTSVGRPQYYGE